MKEFIEEFVEACDYASAEPEPCICGKFDYCKTGIVFAEEDINSECDMFPVTMFALGVMIPAFDEYSSLEKRRPHILELKFYHENNSSYKLRHDLMYRKIREMEIENHISLEELFKLLDDE